MEAENVFKIATSYPEVCEFLTSHGWEFQGKDAEMEMDSLRNKTTGRKLCVKDISGDSPVTFLMGGLGLAEFGELTRELTPEVGLLEVESSWEGRPTTIVVAMTEKQVKAMFGKRAKMTRLPVHRVVSVA